MGGSVDIDWRFSYQLAANTLIMVLDQRGARGNNSPIHFPLLHAMRLFMPLLLTRLSPLCTKVSNAIIDRALPDYMEARSHMRVAFFIFYFLSSSGVRRKLQVWSFFSFQFSTSAAEQKFDYGMWFLGGHALPRKPERQYVENCVLCAKPWCFNVFVCGVGERRGYWCWDI